MNSQNQTQEGGYTIFLDTSPCSFRIVPEAVWQFSALVSGTTAGTDFFTFYPRTKQPSPGSCQRHPFVKWLCKSSTKSRKNLDAVPDLM